VRGCRFDSCADADWRHCRRRDGRFQWVLVGVQVTIIHRDTGQARTVTAAAEGTYRAAALAPAVYRVIAEAVGFKRLAFMRSYEEATRLAAAATAAGEKAANDAVQRKQAAQTEASTAVVDARAAIQEAETALRGVPKGKASKADLEACESDLAAAKLTLGEAEVALNSQRYRGCEGEGRRRQRQGECRQVRRRAGSSEPPGGSPQRLTTPKVKVFRLAFQRGAVCQCQTSHRRQSHRRRLHPRRSLE
jgi:Carboxypeptidase regulatory-like domain